MTSSAMQMIRRMATDGVMLRSSGDALKLRGPAAAVRRWTPEVREAKSLLLACLRSDRLNDVTAASHAPITQAEWLALDRAYQDHHFRCPVCIAAGKGYGERCGVGAILWRSYEATLTPFDKKPKSVREPAQQPVLQEAMPPDLAALIQAAMLACDFWGDGAEARESMRQQCQTVPAHQRRDLTEYFIGKYAKHGHD